MDKGLTLPKMGTDSLAENILHAPEFICPIYLSKPKCLDFNKKEASLGVRSPWVLEILRTIVEDSSCKINRRYANNS